jgi:ABC-2 type transport system ATP-binding protein
MTAAVSTHNLTRSFGALTALDSLTVDIPQGMVGLVGPNGSGKSTCLRLLLGLIKPTSGSATVLGHSIEQPEAFAARVGALIESPSFITTMSARANLRSVAALRGLPDSRVDEVLAIVGLKGREGEKVKTFSLGMKQRLAIAGALLPDPELLILDEPTNGLDPSGIVEIRELLRRLGAEGRTVIVSSHLMSELEATVDHIVVLKFGRLLYSGRVDELIGDSGDIVVVVPEHASQLSLLAKACFDEGLRSTQFDDRLEFPMQRGHAPKVSRIAAEAGIFLQELRPVRRDLEDAFLAMTGTTDEALSTERAEQLISQRTAR